MPSSSTVLPSTAALLTADSISDEQLRGLRALAASQGDDRTVHVASVALGTTPSGRSDIVGESDMRDARERCAARLNARRGTAHTVDDYGDCLSWCAACRAKAVR